MKITNNFIGGKMNVDIDQLLIPKGQYFNGLNIEVVNPENSSDITKYADAGVLRNSLGNKIPVNASGTSLAVVDINGNPLVSARCIGTCIANDLNCVFFIITSTNEDLIVQYIDTPSVDPVGPGVQGDAGTISYILRAPKPTVGDRYLNLNRGNYITGFNYFENFLIWTDNLNPPRMINVTQFKTYTLTNFAWNQDDINVIVKPPVGSAVIALSNDGTPKNNMKDRFLYFSYRWKYTDNRWSTMAPFTQVAFTPASFAFNGQNVTSMYNIYNKVAITVATGDRQVTDIQFLFKDSEFSNIYIIETVNKAKPIVGVPVIPNNSIWTYPTFDNSKTYATLPTYELTRLFDNVPIKALAQDIIGSRIVYGNYTQFYDMKTVWNSVVIPNFSVQAISATIPTDAYRPSLKTNMDYEFGVVYLDDYGRMSTPITSTTNTVHISAQNAGRQNYIRVNINHFPPAWATKYRLFIKQSRYKYYNVFPSRIVLSQEAGVSYYLLNPVDKDKITEGDSVLLKGDYGGITNSTTEYLVLEVAYKDKGALQTNPTDNPAGLYFKIAKTADDNIPDFNVYLIEFIGGVTSPLESNILLSNAGLPLGLIPITTNSWISNLSTFPASWSPVVYYPSSVAALVLPNGATPFYLNSGVASFGHVAYSAQDIRYRIEYVGVVTGFHCFNYRRFNSQTNVNTVPVPFRNAATNAPVLATIKDPTNVITLGQLFISPTLPLFAGDTYRLNLYSNQNGSTIGGRPISKLSLAVNHIGNTIRGGAKITFGEFFEENRVVQNANNINGVLTYEAHTPEQVFVSPATYPDIQEWFWESGAYLEFRQFNSMFVPLVNSKYKNIFFRYGYPTISNGGPSNLLNTRVIQKQGGETYPISNPFVITMMIGSAQDIIAPIVNTNWNKYKSTLVQFRIDFIENPLVFEVYPPNQRDELFHECTENLSIITSGNKKYHAGYLPIGVGPVQNQTDFLPAVLFLNPGPTITSATNTSFNCWAFSNGVELNRIGDAYNKPTTEWSPRVMVPVLDYSQQVVGSGLTYSGTYKVDSNINNLNAFNLSLGNFKYLERSFGSVQKIKSRDTDLVVIHQDQVTKVLYGKNLLSDSVGGGDVVSIPEVLGTQIAYQGEYGISNNPESFAQWGDSMYFTDSQRGAVLRLDNQGLFDVSQYGMKSFFNASFKLQPDTIKVGVFDGYYKRYLLTETGFVKPQPPIVPVVVALVPPIAYSPPSLINNVLFVQ